MSNISLEQLIKNYDKNHLSYLKASKKYNEHLCRTDYIDPFLELLGWDVRNEKGVKYHIREIIAEDYDEEIGKPDYTVTLCGIPKFFIEAKKPSVDITKDSVPAIQARKYGWNGGHKITVLTNFEDLIIYDATYVPTINDKWDVALIRHYHYTEYIEKFDEIKKLLSHDAVYSEEYDAYISKILNITTLPKKSVDEAFLLQINEWRVQLSNYLYTKSNYKDIERLNDIVQRFINQIVFLRICEDRNLPLYHKLSEIKDSKVLIEELNKLILDSDSRYNSGLFSGTDIVFDLNNNIIFEMIDKLYFPKSIYQFDIIETNLLGKIYEQFLTEQLVVIDNEKIILSKKKDFKDRSIVTTPYEIVKYIVNQALTPLCIDKTPDEILSLRIADICCGSGVFLEEAFNYLVTYCVDWYLEHDPLHLEVQSNGRSKLPFFDKKQLLSSCIFGIDIDYHAVEVSKFSLLLKLIEGETCSSVDEERPILPNLDQNIVFGNALISYDHVKCINEEQKKQIVPFDWDNFNNGELFDAIVGNPPYVNTECMNNLLLPVEINAYKKSYLSAYRQFDKYFIFIERAYDKLKPCGYLCYIVPNKFFTNISGEKLREFLASKKCLLNIDDFGSEQLFEDKTIYSTILTLNKRENESFYYSRLSSISSLLTNKGFVRTLSSQEKLTQDIWVFSDNARLLQIYDKLIQTHNFVGDEVEFINGIQTSAEKDSCYWFSKTDCVAENQTEYIVSKDGKEFPIEKSILKPYFKPTKKAEKKLGTYDSPLSDKLIIFPYDEEGKLFDIDTMKTSYSGAYAYLLNNYDLLLPKEFGGKRDVKPLTGDINNWYSYGRQQALTIFNNRNKLIVGVMRKDEPMYAYDENNYLIASGGTAGYCAVILKEGGKYELEYMQAWLTHPLTQSIIKMIGSNFDSAYSSAGTAVLKHLPFVPIDFTNEIDAKRYSEVIEKTREIYAINKKLQGLIREPVRVIETRNKKRLIKEIEEIITEIYKKALGDLYAITGK